MIVHFAISDNDTDNAIVNFLIKQKFYNFAKLEDIKLLQGNKLIIFKQDTDLKNHNSILQLMGQQDSFSSFLVIPLSLKKINAPKNFIKIIYPVNYTKFESTIWSFIKFNKFIYMGLSLSMENILHNHNNNKKIYVTETESNILKLLFVEKIVNKENLKLKILNLQPNIETKSIESHLSRIRKKISEINGKIEIISTESKFVEVRAAN